jgi:2-aminoadipate transaminase
MNSFIKHKKQTLFADRMNTIPKSFIREILKVTSQPDVISFAGGLPNPLSFPSKEICASALHVLTEDSSSVLQYAVSEGYLPLREYLSKRYIEKGIPVSPEEILITNGSQQGLDLCGKIFLNEGDKVLMEAPSYLGAIQAFSAYQPEFLSVKIQEDGVDTKQLSEMLWEHDIKLFYGIPNFQNPTGISYSDEKRKEVAELLKKTNTIFIEDDPYGEIRFSGEALSPIKKYLPDQTILLGSFSKIVAPGLRMGWVVAKKEFIEKLIIAKQAADLHSNFLSQRILYHLLSNFDIDKHTKRISELYRKQKDYMIDMIQIHFPKEIKYTNPYGGMFIWLTLPDYMDAQEILKESTILKVAFVPGETFFVNEEGKNTIRLNFSNSKKEETEEGIKRLGKLFARFIIPCLL